MRTVVELLDINGEWWNLTTGDRGVYLATGVQGLYDPPVKVVYEEPGNYPGARYLNHRILRRDIVFGAEILNDRKDGSDKSWMRRDSKWRKAWAFNKDCYLFVTTEESGTRFLKLRLGQSIDVSLEDDPDGNPINLAKMLCISGDPFWYEDAVVYSATTLTDTRFDPTVLPWPWPQNALPTETLHITVDPADGKGGLNPTDEAVFITWQVPGSTQKPAAPYVPGVPWLGAPQSPATIWTLPDYDFEPPEEGEPDQSNRRLRMPGLIGGLRTNCVQVIQLTGGATSGGFTPAIDGHPTASPVPFNAAAATVTTALEALPGIGAGNVTVTKTTGVTTGVTSFKCEFKNALEGQPVPEMTVTNTLSGGTTPWATVTTTVVGVTAPAENATIDTDPRVEQVTSESGSQLWARMNGVRFRYPVPPYTASKTFEITVSGCPIGQMVTMRIPRPWTRPWGLE